MEPILEFNTVDTIKLLKGQDMFEDIKMLDSISLGQWISDAMCQQQKGNIGHLLDDFIEIYSQYNMSGLSHGITACKVYPRTLENILLDIYVTFARDSRSHGRILCLLLSKGCEW
jgi:hypothetical protein